MQISGFNSESTVRQAMQDIGVDPYGIEIMLPKTQGFTIRLKSISYIWANILKQELLALGGDLALSRGALGGKVKKTDGLMIGQLAQFNALTQKLKIQPFGLAKFGQELALNLKNYQCSNFSLCLGKYRFDLSRRTHIMGIINLTPDSFSGDGLYAIKTSYSPELALAKAEKLLSEGADIIDLGGESTRPGAKSISVKEELRRTIPVIKLLAKKIKAPLSIDTRKFQVAKAALDVGALLVNDVSGLRDQQMAKIVASFNAAVVLMHMRGTPEKMQKNIKYHSLLKDIQDYLKQQIAFAQAQGVKPEKIIIDPGIGFGKTLSDNLELIKHLDSFKVLGKPLLLGASRKSFIAKVVGDSLEDRFYGNLATSVLAARKGARILRVHDVKQVKSVLKMEQALN